MRVISLCKGTHEIPIRISEGKEANDGGQHINQKGSYGLSTM